ncbi:MAG: hypothetical protein KDA75_03165 [Planctomycetaceae bacterium]|nr:hypothetical protein [Planctomycetaceae bacterium]
MRLTLRTLLGYLDDILEPQQTREIGEKVSESGFAAALVARIREVVRRRRIAAPEVSGPGADPEPNVIAEYLDNTLAPEKVEDLERLCLDSDVHLAEVASCHQILTMVLGDPVDVPPATRERMYALGSVSASDPRAASEVAPRVAASPPPPPKPEVPEYLSSGRNWRSVLPGAAGLLVVGVWLGLIFSDPNQSWRIWEPAVSQTDSTATDSEKPEAPAGEPEAGSEKVAVAEANAPPQQAPEPGVEATLGGEPAVVASPPTVGEVADAEAVINPNPPPADVSAAMAAITPPRTAAPPALPRPGVGSEPGPPAVAPQADAAPASAPVSESKLLYNAPEGVLLRFDPEEHWQVLPRRTLLHVGDELVSPEPFEATIQILNSDCQMVVAGGSRVFLLPADNRAGALLLIDRGRVIFRRSATAPLPESTRIDFQIDGGNYELELTQAGAELGLEVIPQASSAPRDRLQTLRVDGGLFLTSGAATLTPDGGDPISLDATAGFLQLVNGRLAEVRQPLLSPPAWMTPLSGGAAAVAQQTARQFEDAFQLGLSVDATIPALVEARYPRISELATRTLVLTDNVVGMVRALSAPHEESRQAALVGLATWIRRDPGNAQILDDELHRVFMEDDAARMARLVWGFGPQDAQDPQTSQELVEWLADPEVAVREAAFYHIRRLTGGQLTYRYHPDLSELKRSMSIKQWESHIQKEGALIEPAPTPAESPTELEVN